MFFSLVLTFKTKSLSPNEKLKYSLLGISAICKIEYMRIFSSNIYNLSTFLPKRSFQSVI